jgi:hypothetical protein
MDLSVIIPGRNEEFLKRTIDCVLAAARAETEIIAVCDGAWPDPQIPDHPRVRLTHSATVIGQRAATNLGARMSTATYVMKLDAHCDVAPGFDVDLIKADQELNRPDLTQIPAMYNLHAFNWKCKGCGTETYQGPTPTLCAHCGAKGTPGGPFERVMYWDLKAGGVPGRDRRTEFWRFDHELHFQYWHDARKRPESQGELVDVMSSVGACFFMRRERFHEIGGLDEAHGSWGQFGTEIACKSWLSGGRQIVNKRTWFAHLFRTQGGDFSFPYANPQTAVNKAREHSRKLWIDGTWPLAKYPLTWMLDQFAPIPDWTKERVDAIRPRTSQRRGVRATSGVVRSDGTHPEPASADRSAVTRGLAYYSDCRGDAALLEAVRAQLDHARPKASQIVAVTLTPMYAPLPWRLRVLPLERGYLAMFKQQLAALEMLGTDIAFMVEHDVLYHPSHFEFTPPRDDTFYYNQHTYRVDAATGQGLFYYCNQVSGLCANRKLLVEHYRQRVAYVEAHGFDRNIGFEPGSNRKARELFGGQVETWMSEGPNVDIKTANSLTPGRWDQSQFRNKNSCQGWKLVDEIPGWGVSKGRFSDFLAGIPALERSA